MRVPIKLEKSSDPFTIYHIKTKEAYNVLGNYQTLCFLVDLTESAISYFTDDFNNYPRLELKSIEGHILVISFPTLIGYKLFAIKLGRTLCISVVNKQCFGVMSRN